MWVPSYVGIPRNEIADQIANETVTSHQSMKINLATALESLNIIDHITNET
jgi:ribonuclease HI